MKGGICKDCGDRWDWILPNGLCLVCNANATECDENSPIVEDGKEICK